MRPPPPQEKPPAGDAYGQQGAYEQDPYAGSQGGYQPDYNQQGYNQVIGVSQLLKWYKIQDFHEFYSLSDFFGHGYLTDSWTNSNSLWFSSSCVRRLSTVKAMPSREGPHPFPIRCEPTKVCVLGRGLRCSRSPGQNQNNKIFFSLSLNRKSPEWTNSGLPTSDPQCNTLPFMGWVRVGILEMLRKT